MRRIPIKIIYEDQHLIVIDKSEGLLSVGTAKGREEITAHRLLNNYLQNAGSSGAKMRRDVQGREQTWRRCADGERRNRGRGGQSSSPRAYIVHRLDRETSGLMVFAKSEEIKYRLQENWENAVTMRGYVAVVNGMPQTDEQGNGVIRSWLKENRAFVVYSSPVDNGGQLAITRYKVLGSNASRRKTLLGLELETGRKNQIRVHMQEAGCPIYGDKKYFGDTLSLLAENKKARRLYLHAYALHFIHPVTGEQMKFTTGIPSSFREEIRR